METYEYHQMLKYLYFEGYADSYKDAEELIEELTDEEFDSLYEEVFINDSYETIISYLLDEGYAEDLDSANVIYENMSEGWKTDALKSTLKTAGKVAKYGAKKLNQSKFGKRAKRFIGKTALGAIGIPMIS